MTALASSAIRAFCEALSIRPVRKRRRMNARKAALQVYHGAQNHWGSVGAHAVSSLKIAHEKLGKDGNPK